MTLPVKRASLAAWAVGYLSTLRLPVLFALTAVVFAVDLVVPDVLPLVDEVMLGLATAILGSWRRRRREHAAGPEETAAPHG